MLELANMWTIFMTFVLYGIFSKRSWWQWGQFSKVLLLKIRVSMKSHCNCFISINIGAKIMSNCIKDILFLIKCDEFTSLDEVCKAFLLVCVVKSKNHVQGKCKNGQKRHHQDNYRGNHWLEIDNTTMGFSLILDIEGMVNSTLSTSVDSKYFINSIILYKIFDTRRWPCFPLKHCLTYSSSLTFTSQIPKNIIYCSCDGSNKDF